MWRDLSTTLEMTRRSLPLYQYHWLLGLDLEGRYNKPLLSVQFSKRVQFHWVTVSLTNHCGVVFMGESIYRVG